MKRWMSILAVVLISVLMLGSLAYAQDETESIQLKGYVEYNKLEGGFYELSGYRLTGDFDFEEFEGKLVSVVGYLDTSPSIYMTKAVEVIQIVEISAAAYKHELQNRISQVERQINANSLRLQQYIRIFGEDSNQVLQLRNTILNLNRELESLRQTYFRIIGEDKKDGEDDETEVEPIEIEGIVTYNEVEGGYYEVFGYRLTGDYDFSDYLNEMVKVTGVEDNSPSIFMVKTIEVLNIEVIEKEEARFRLTERERKILDELGYINKNRHAYIKKAGKNGYRLKLNTLKKQIRQVLMNRCLLDGKDIDLNVYKKLGQYINTEKGKVNLFLNGKQPNYDQDVLPFVEDGRTLVPFRAVAESMGAKVGWDGKRKMVTVTKGDKEIKMKIGLNIAHVNNKAVILDVPAKIIYNRTVIPLRFVAENLGADVKWIPQGKIAVITYDSEKGMLLDTEADFEVTYRFHTFTLGEWEDEADVDEVLGNPILEKVEQLGEDADTFEGTYVKTLFYEGAKLQLMSPEDNGDDFYISKIEITSPDYLTARDITIGDSYEKVMANYGMQEVPEGNDARHYTYTFSNENNLQISFAVQNGKVVKITLEKLIP